MEEVNLSGGNKESKTESKTESTIESKIKSNRIIQFLKEYKYEILLSLISIAVVLYKLWTMYPSLPSLSSLSSNLLNDHGSEYSGNIDLVYTWVDGSDKNWLQKKNKYSKNQNQKEDNIRFTTIDELKYSLRSAYEHASWINNIYIVADDVQKPTWLNIDHPKIHLIKHSQIFKNTSDLPSFNSFSIESNLHNIPGLSENFLYLNDDMFFGNHTQRNEFITPSGKLLYYPYPTNCVFDTEKIPDEEAWWYSWTKTQSLLKNKLNIEPSCQWHFGIMLKKSHFTEVKKIFPEEFQNVSASKFRHKTNIVPYGIAYQYGLNKNDYEIKPPLTSALVDARFDLKYINNGLRNIQQMKPKMFCINNVSNYDKNIVSFLEYYFPDKSPYEI